MADKPPEKTLNALLLEGETTLRDIRGKQARVAELDGRVLSAVTEALKVSGEANTAANQFYDFYRDLATRVNSTFSQLEGQIRGRDDTISRREDELTRIRGERDRYKGDYNRVTKELDQLRRAANIRPSDPTKAYVEWVRGRYKPLFVKESVPFVAYDHKDGKLLDAAARFLLYSRSGINVILDGPTGSGKSTLMEWAAFNEKLPMHLVPPVKDVSYREVIGEYAQDGTLTPGPVPLFLIFGGYLGFDEAPNLNPKVAVALHSLLQGKPLRFETHLGPVDIDPGQESHRIVGSCNFAYQRPNFNPATLQRCSFMDLPSMDRAELGKILSGSGGSAAPFSNYTALLRDSHPWFFGNGHSQEQGKPYLWMPSMGRSADSVLTSLNDMMLDVRDAVLKAGKDLYHEELDLSPATLKRSISLYSPKLDARTMRDIVTENVITPVAVMYPHNKDEKAQLTQRVYQAMEKHLQQLRMR